MADRIDSFGYWVRRRRRALDLSQAELARQIPCSLTMIKKIEGDQRRPSVAMAERIAVCLGLNTGERKDFLAVARGLHAVDSLVLDESPVSRSVPIDRLPAAITPFIGRQSELTALAVLLASPDVRLLNIVGPGGMGKTRLALAAAHAQCLGQPRTFQDGIVFVELASVVTPDFVILAIAEALGLDLTARRDDLRSPTQQLLDFLRPRQMLLVLDNLEHLLDGGIAGSILDILRGAPAVKVLATSRQRLNLREEQLYTLAGLPFPSGPSTEYGDPRAQDAAAQLLLAAARRLRPDYELLPGDQDNLGRICRLVEGMPLALELAAAWVDTLSLGDIAAELHGSLDILASDLVDLPERHRSIRTTFDATWRRLEPAERETFARLSVFRGGLTRAAAEQVASATLPVLARLIGKCLLQFHPTSERYHLHEVLRQYGLERLDSQEALASVQQRHFEYFQALAETATERLFGSEQIVWLDRLEAEHDNLRAALTWAFVEPGFGEPAARLVIALGWFWRIRSHVLEALTWLERALLLSNLTTETRAALLYHAGHFAWMQDDFALAREREEESLRLWQSLGEAGRRGAGYANHTLGMAIYGTELHAQGDLASAVQAFQRSQALFEEVDDAWGIAFSLQWLAFAYTAQRRKQAALAAAEKSLAGFRRLGNPWGAGMTMGSLVTLKMEAGDLVEARRLAEEAQVLRSQVGHRHSLGVGLELLARIALLENRQVEAIAYYAEAIEVFESLGNRSYADQIRAAATSVEWDADDVE